MDIIITTLGWILYMILIATLTAFAVACIYGCAQLGYHISTRLIRERRLWKRIVRQGNYKIIQYAAIVMSDRLGYGENATLGDIINDTDNKLKNNREK